MMIAKSLITFMAVSVSLASAIVWDATILHPNANTELTAGQKYTVNWKTEMEGVKIPDSVIGAVLLGYREPKAPEHEHLDWTLAKDFKLNKGSVEVTIPDNLSTRNSYIMALIGDTGDITPPFTINANNSSSTV